MLSFPIVITDFIDFQVQAGIDSINQTGLTDAGGADQTGNFSL